MTRSLLIAFFLSLLSNPVLASYIPSGQFYCEAEYIDSTSKSVIEFSKNGREFIQKTVGSQVQYEFVYTLLGQPYDDIFVYYTPGNSARPMMTFKFQWDGKSAKTQEVSMLTDWAPYLGVCEKI